MNKYLCTGRLTRDPIIRETHGEKPIKTASFTLAVDRNYKAEEGQPNADFPNVEALGKLAEWVEKYARKGLKLELEGELRTGNYTNREGQKVYYTKILADRLRFAESRKASNVSSTAPAGTAMASAPDTTPVTVKAPVQSPEQAAPTAGSDDFMDIEPSDFDSDLPFE